MILLGLVVGLGAASAAAASQDTPCYELDTDQPCNERGLCIDLTGCACMQGWSGTHCEESTATDDEPADRICTYSCIFANRCEADAATGACSCAENWTGTFCEQPLCTGDDGQEERCKDAGWVPGSYYETKDVPPASPSDLGIGCTEDTCFVSSQQLAHEYSLPAQATANEAVRMCSMLVVSKSGSPDLIRGALASVVAEDEMLRVTSGIGYGTFWVHAHGARSWDFQWGELADTRPALQVWHSSVLAGSLDEDTRQNYICEIENWEGSPTSVRPPPDNVDVPDPDAHVEANSTAMRPPIGTRAMRLPRFTGAFGTNAKAPRSEYMYQPIERGTGVTFTWRLLVTSQYLHMRDVDRSAPFLATHSEAHFVCSNVYTVENTRVFSFGRLASRVEIDGLVRRNITGAMTGIHAHSADENPQRHGDARPYVCAIDLYYEPEGANEDSIADFSHRHELAPTHIERYTSASSDDPRAMFGLVTGKGLAVNLGLPERAPVRTAAMWICPSITVEGYFSRGFLYESEAPGPSGRGEYTCAVYMGTEARVDRQQCEVDGAWDGFAHLPIPSGAGRSLANHDAVVKWIESRGEHGAAPVIEIPLPNTRTAAIPVPSRRWIAAGINSTVDGDVLQTALRCMPLRVKAVEFDAVTHMWSLLENSDGFQSPCWEFSVVDSVMCTQVRYSWTCPVDDWVGTCGANPGGYAVAYVTQVQDYGGVPSPSRRSQTKRAELVSAGHRWSDHAYHSDEIAHAYERATWIDSVTAGPSGSGASKAERTAVNVTQALAVAGGVAAVVAMAVVASRRLGGDRHTTQGEMMDIFGSGQKGAYSTLFGKVRRRRNGGTMVVDDELSSDEYENMRVGCDEVDASQISDGSVHEGDGDETDASASTTGEAVAAAAALNVGSLEPREAILSDTHGRMSIGDGGPVDHMTMPPFEHTDEPGTAKVSTEEEIDEEDSIVEFEPDK